MRRSAIALVAMVISGCGASPSVESIAVGAGPDRSSGVLAHLYAAALRYYGNAVHVAHRTDPVTDLDRADVVVVPGFTGRLMKRFDPDAVARGDEQVYRTMIASLPEGVAAGDYARSADDKPAPATSDRVAQAWGGKEVSVLLRHCGELRVGSVWGTPPPPVVGTCRMPVAREFTSAATMFDALQSGQVNVVWTSTAAPGVPEDAVVLADRTSLIRAENVVPLYRRNQLSERQVLALNEIAGELDTGALANMLREVDGGSEPAVVASEWLDSHPLGHG